MKIKNFSWRGLIAVIAALAMLRAVGRTVIAQPAYLPRPSDRAATNRVERPTRGVDQRTTVIDGNMVAGPGVVEPADRETRVAGSVSGRIARLAVREGQRVQAGELLIELDATVERAAMAVVQAELQTAQADLARTRQGSRREDIEAANAEADAASARAQLSGSVLQRQQTLAPSGAITVDELDRSRRQAEVDAITARVSDARRRSTRAGSRVEDIAASRARVVAAQARLNQQQAAIDRLSIRAPIAGEILQVRYRVGEYYSPGGADALIVMGDTNTLRARMDVDERDIARVRVGQVGFATADAWPGRRFAGHVVEVARRMGRKNVRTDDPTERLDTKILEVVLQLDEPRDLLLGQRVTAYLQAE